ncbi:TlpA family protein disulfide reductase [Halorientalis regularis]|jgi:thiol-disulfide isomerase/thioredoxin|uniref:Thiol-disulfide isomerase or thioredoxin n=1 Tax=Halorientalis regularis TaxID=660518 RepID=A0A1G7FRF9_9EURY|nr:TlpA disulfide reductase family protein [Halorientalis regularis]SDE78481.1 Thiol-disulfide isomerase or thioredoxin [Halorientalis regularis]
MRGYDRRTFLTATGAAVTALSGCTQLPGSRDGPGASGDGDAGTGDGAQTLDTLDVGGSPGETMAVVPDGTVTLLDFFATYCAPCKPQMAELREVRSAFPDVHMLSITWERDAATVRSFWREYDGTWPVAMDPEVETGPVYDVRALPTMLVVDADGAETWRHKGLAAAATIETELEAARQ